MPLNPQAFQACFADWFTALREAAAEATGVERPTLAVDGMTLRRSHDRSKHLGALHSMNVWASELGLDAAAFRARKRRAPGFRTPSRVSFPSGPVQCRA